MRSVELGEVRIFIWRTKEMKRLSLVILVPGILILAGSSFLMSSQASEESDARKLVKESRLTSDVPTSRCTRLAYGAPPTLKEKAAAKAAAATLGASGETTALPGTRCLRYTLGKRVGKYLPNLPPKIEIL